MNFLSVLGIGILRIFQSVLNKKSSTYLTSTKTYIQFGFYFETVASIFAILYLFVVGFNGFNLPTVLCSAITGALFLLELLTALKVLKSAPLVLCTMCSLGGGVILPTISGIFLFNEPMHLLQWCAILIFFLSAYLLSPSDNKRWSIDKYTFVLLAFNFLVNGLCGIVGKYFAVKVENGNPALFACLSYAFAALLFSIVLIIMKNNKESSNAPFDKKLLVLGGFVGLVCTTIVYFSTVLSRIVPIVQLNTVPNAVCIVGNFILGVLLFKEKFTITKLIGVVLSIISTVLIVIF